MKTLTLALETAAGFALASLCLGCNYYKEQTGYLVTHSETTWYHYNSVYMDDVKEYHYTLIHSGVKFNVHVTGFSGIVEFHAGEVYQCNIEDNDLLCHVGKERYGLTIDSSQKE